MSQLTLPTVYLIRHGQSYFNVAYDSTEDGKVEPIYDLKYVDACLTDLGIQQAINARKQAKQLNIEVIISSPLTRAIQTSLLIFNEQLDERHFFTSSNTIPENNELVELSNQIPVLVSHHHSEILNATCDIGHGLENLQQRFQHHHHLIDWSAMNSYEHRERWWHKANEHQNISHLLLYQSHGHVQHLHELDSQKIRIVREEHEHVTARIKAFLTQLSQHTEARIAVVGHGTFFKNLVGRYIANCEIVQLDWNYCAMKYGIPSDPKQLGTLSIL